MPCAYLPCRYDVLRLPLVRTSYAVPTSRPVRRRRGVTFGCIELAPNKNRPTLVSLLERIFAWPGYFFAALFCLAQRAFCASEISLRAAADIVRRFFGAEVAVCLLILPGGLPRRFAEPEPPLTPSKASIAASSLLRSSLSCWTISFTFIELS